MRWITTLTLVVCLCLGAFAASAERRVALVIGNGQYRFAPKLPNGASDAWALSKTLKNIGFDVTLGVELSGQKFASEIDQFRAKSADADVIIVYYSSHGFQKNGENYLLPIDAKLDSIADFNNSAIPLKAIFAVLAKNSI